jgi:hypothetical protein
METKEFIKILKKKYPLLASSIVSTVGERKEEMGELRFHNPRYSLWFTAENNSFVVGINFLHNHFDSSDYELNLEEALVHIDDIIQDRIVAIGNRDKENDFLLATMSKEEGIKHYSSENSKIEIVSFSKEY